MAGRGRAGGEPGHATRAGGAGPTGLGEPDLAREAAGAPHGAQLHGRPGRRQTTRASNREPSSLGTKRKNKAMSKSHTSPNQLFCKLFVRFSAEGRLSQL